MNGTDKFKVKFLDKRVGYLHCNFMNFEICCEQDITDK